MKDEALIYVGLGVNEESGGCWNGIDEEDCQVGDNLIITQGLGGESDTKLVIDYLGG